MNKSFTKQLNECSQSIQTQVNIASKNFEHLFSFNKIKKSNKNDYTTIYVSHKNLTYDISLSETGELKLVSGYLTESPKNKFPFVNSNASHVDFQEELKKSKKIFKDSDGLLSAILMSLVNYSDTMEEIADEIEQAKKFEINRKSYLGSFHEHLMENNKDENITFSSSYNSLNVNRFTVNVAIDEKISATVI